MTIYTLVALAAFTGAAVAAAWTIWATIAPNAGRIGSALRGTGAN